MTATSSSSIREIELVGHEFQRIRPTGRHVDASMACVCRSSAAKSRSRKVVFAARDPMNKKVVGRPGCGPPEDGPARLTELEYTPD
jgi:hypothetical protein